jgi:hypothetical protein
MAPSFGSKAVTKDGPSGKKISMIFSTQVLIFPFSIGHDVKIHFSQIVAVWSYGLVIFHVLKKGSVNNKKKLTKMAKSLQQ